jgi:hypothetical protein
MPWQGPYYYRARKVNGRVVRQYVGRGEAAEIVAAADAEEREEREYRAERLRAFRADLDRLDGLVGEADEAVAAVVQAALLAAGYQQHRRGEWRRQRVKTSQTNRPAE